MSIHIGYHLYDSIHAYLFIKRAWLNSNRLKLFKPLAASRLELLAEFYCKKMFNDFNITKPA